MAITSRVAFSWPHHGNHVQLAGTFNDWNPADMVKNDNVWTVTLEEVPIGKHQFKFVVDGQWVHDVDQHHVQNEMGSFNNEIEVEVVKPEVKPTIEVLKMFYENFDFTRFSENKKITVLKYLGREKVFRSD